MNVQPHKLPSPALNSLDGGSASKKVSRFSDLTLGVWLAVCLIGLGLYGFTANFPFQFDDEVYIVRNPLIRDFSNFALLFDVAKAHRTVQENNLPVDAGTNFILRPVTYLTFAVNYAISGLSPRGFRWVNILLHCANAILVFHLLRRLLGATADRLRGDSRSQIFIPVAAALLFLVHPLQVESVTYIVQRSASLGTFFYLLTFLLYFTANGMVDGGKKTLARIGSVLALVAGMLSKEEVFTAPFMLILLDWLVMGTSWKVVLRRAWPMLACLPILPALLVAVSASHHGGANVLTAAAPGIHEGYQYSYALTEFRVVLMYLGLLLLPRRLNLDWDVPLSTSLMDGWVLASAAAIVAILAWAWYFHGRKRAEVRHALIFVFVLWYFVTLAVSSSIVPLPDVMAEHRTYLASVGFIAMLVLLADLLRTYLAKTERAWLVPASAALGVVVLGCATVQRNQVWGTSASLWADAATQSPDKCRPWDNLGAALAEEGKLDLALPCFRRAVTLKQETGNQYGNLAGILVMMKQYDEAVTVCDEGLKTSKNQPGLYFNRAIACWNLGRKDDAVAGLEKAVTLAPKFLMAHVNLAQFYAKMNKLVEAKKEYDIAVSLHAGSKQLQETLALIRSKEETASAN